MLTSLEMLLLLLNSNQFSNLCLSLDMSRMILTCHTLHLESWVGTFQRISILSLENFFSQNLSLHFVLANLLFIVCVFAVMSFPADGIESTYKNNIDDVRDFLDAKYPDNYLIINVSPRTYRTEKLGDRVCLI